MFSYLKFNATGTFELVLTAYCRILPQPALLSLLLSLFCLSLAEMVDVVLLSLNFVVSTMPRHSMQLETTGSHTYIHPWSTTSM